MTRVEVLAIGDELLDGRVQDGNGAYLAQELGLRHVRVTRATTVGDDEGEIAAALGEAAARAQVIVCSGGLGPTVDDRTREAAARWLGVGVEQDGAALAAIQARFEAMGRAMAPNNARQACFPAGARVLVNEVGTAPAFVCEDSRGVRAYFLPGVPFEYRWLVDRYVVGEVVGGGAAQRLARWRLGCFGCGESELEHGIRDVELPSSVTLGYRPHFPELDVTIFARRDVGEVGDVEADVAAARAALVARLGRFVIAEGEESAAARLGRLLMARGERVTCAESCTGGMVAALITSVGGSSAYFDEAVVSYANAAKVARLGVEEATLQRWGAVSLPAVVEMARGARARSGATWALAVSGIAGPGGGTAEKPVGTVWVALDGPEGTWARRLGMAARWGRERIRQGTTLGAVQLLLLALEGRAAEWVGGDLLGPQGVIGPIGAEGWAAWVEA